MEKSSFGKDNHAEGAYMGDQNTLGAFEFILGHKTLMEIMRSWIIKTLSIFGDLIA